MINPRLAEIYLPSILAILLISLLISDTHSVLLTQSTIEKMPAPPHVAMDYSETAKQAGRIISEFRTVEQSLESWILARLVVYAKKPPSLESPPTVDDKTTFVSTKGKTRRASSSNSKNNNPAVESSQNFTIVKNRESNNEIARISLSSANFHPAALTSDEAVSGHALAGPTTRKSTALTIEETANLEDERSGDGGDEDKVLRRVIFAMSNILGIKVKTYMKSGIPSGTTDITVNLNDYIALAGFVDHGEIFNRYGKSGEPLGAVTGTGGGLKIDIFQKDDRIPSLSLKAGYSIPVEKNVVLSDNTGAWHISAMIKYRY